MLLTDGKYGDRAIQIIRVRFPDAKFVVIPENNLNEFIDEYNFEKYVEQDIENSDLIISYIRHPDVVMELCNKGKPTIIAINFGVGFYHQIKEINSKVVMPPTMCRLQPNTGIPEIDDYARYFGIPLYTVDIDTSKTPAMIKEVIINSESPCGATKRTLHFLKNKPIVPKTFNEFGLSVSQECREPMSILLKRSQMAESAAAVHRIHILKTIKNNAPELFNESSEMLEYYNKALYDYEHPKDTSFYGR